MVYYAAALLTLFLAASVFAHDNSNDKHCKPRPNISGGPSPSPVVSYVTITETMTVTETILCSTPGSSNYGGPTNLPKPPVELTPSPLPTSITFPSSPVPSILPSSPPVHPSVDPVPSLPGYPSSPGMSPPVDTSTTPGMYPPVGTPTNPGMSSPAGTPTSLSSSPIIQPPSSSNPPPIPSSSSSSSPVSSPTSSVVSSTGLPPPTYTGKYDRNAICGGQKRESNPFDALSDHSKRHLRRRLSY